MLVRFFFSGGNRISRGQKISKAYLGCAKACECWSLGRHEDVSPVGAWWGVGVGVHRLADYAGCYEKRERQGGKNSVSRTPCRLWKPLPPEWRGGLTKCLWVL